MDDQLVLYDLWFKGLKMYQCCVIFGMRSLMPLLCNLGWEIKRPLLCKLDECLDAIVVRTLALLDFMLMLCDI